MQEENTQQFGRRNTCTPTGAAPARSNCDLSLKVPRGKDGVAGLKTLPNNSEEHLQTWACLGLQPLKLPAALGGEKGNSSPC